MGKEVDWTKLRAGLRVHNERKETDKKCVKKEGTADSKNQLDRKVLHNAMEERGSTVQTRKQTVGGKLC